MLQQFIVCNMVLVEAIGLGVENTMTIEEFNLDKKRCKESKKLFVDPCFSSIDQSIFMKGHEEESVEWKRPTVSLFVLFFSIFCFSFISGDC